MANDIQCQHHKGTNEMPSMCISIVPIFNHLDKSEMADIMKHTTPVLYRRNDIIYRAGEESRGLYIVHQGRVKIYRLSNQGKEQLIRILGPGDFTGEFSLFSDNIHDDYATALEQVQICMLTKQKFEQYLHKYPTVSVKVLQEFAERLSRLEHQTTSIALETTESRIAMYLAEQVERQQSDQITLTMSRKDIASFLGTTPETVSRKLTEFEQAGWILQEGQRRITIKDLDALLLV